jgi:hypothetical protein
MSKIPAAQNTTASAIDRWHELQRDGERYHLGASMLGHHCDRYLWLSFRWAFKEKFSGRMLRLFRRGQNEEATVVKDLRSIGCQVDAEENGKQYRVNFGGHVSGSMDGIIRSGVPEAPNKPHVLEIKTHGDKSFKQLQAKGVSTSKPMHYAQCQVYMHGEKIDRALYVAVNKNDDTLHIERIRYEPETAKAYIDRGHRIVASDRMPEPCPGASPDWYLCKFCPAYDQCHGSQTVKQVNCRTCAHSTAESDGTWSCARWDSTIPNESQRDGCPDHVIHPDLVPWNTQASDDGLSVVYIVEGNPVRNGVGGVSSVDLLANPGMMSEPLMQGLKEMGAQVVAIKNA